LRGDSAGADGEQLIDSLVREHRPQRAARIRDAQADGQSKAGSEPRQDVLADLVKTDQEPKRPRAREAAPIPAAPENIDASVIDSLLGDSSSKGQQSKNDD
jgi:hypothetical protein